MKNKNIGAIVAIALGLLVIIGGAYYGYSKLSADYSEPASSAASASSEASSVVSSVSSEAVSPEASSQEVQSVAYTAADFTVYDLDGNAAKLSDNSGKIVLLNFWATWCGPCLGELPDFQKTYEEYKDRVNFMFVEVSGTRTDIASFAAKKGYTMPFYTDVSGDAQSAYNVRTIPRTYVFGPTGEQLDSHTGSMSYTQIKALLDKAIG